MFTVKLPLLLDIVNLVILIQYTGIGRKNETDYNICSFYCVRKLFTVIKSLCFRNLIWDVPKLFK